MLITQKLKDENLLLVDIKKKNKKGRQDTLLNSEKIEGIEGIFSELSEGFNDVFAVENKIILSKVAHLYKPSNSEISIFYLKSSTAKPDESIIKSDFENLRKFILTQKQVFSK